MKQHTSNKFGSDNKPTADAPVKSVAAKPSDIAIAHDSQFTIEITKTTTPRDIRDWIAKLDELVEQKKKRVRDDLAAQVNGLLADNEYTVEELLGARILPSTADLAELARKSKDDAKQRALKTADSAM